MNLLVDTHVLLWWLADDPRLPEPARAAIAAPEHRVSVSAASAWEIAIKRALGKLEAPDDLRTTIITLDVRFASYDVGLLLPLS